MLSLTGHKNNGSVFTAMSCCYCFSPHCFQSDECNNSCLWFFAMDSCTIVFPSYVIPFPCQGCVLFCSYPRTIQWKPRPPEAKLQHWKIPALKSSFKSEFLKRSCCLQKAQLKPDLNAAYLTQDEDGKILFSTYQSLFINKQTVHSAQGVSWASFAPHSHWPQVFYSVSHSFYCPLWSVPLYLEVASKGWHFCDPS